MPEAEWLSAEDTLTYLHSTISTCAQRIGIPETPMHLDALLADEVLVGGLAPQLGAKHVRCLSITGFPASTVPGMLDELNRLGFAYRWTTRAICLDKVTAQRMLTRIRRLIHGDVGFLASSLIVIDVTLALLFWTWGEGEDIIARLVRKTLQIGFFAFLIANWNGLAKIIYLSFSGIGLKAAGSGSAEDLLHPGKIAQIGIDAGRPLLDQASLLVGPVAIFTNFVQIAVLLLAWAIVLLAFFIIAIQLFVTLIEFKLTTLAGFVLVPFGLFGRTAFLAERVLGNVMATGVKVLVLAVIIGIGSTIFREFIVDFGGAPPTLEQVASIALASLTLLGIAIFGPGIASGLISGGPQLGAGAAVATGAVVGGIGAATTMGVAGAAGLARNAGSAAASTLSRSAGSPPAGGSPSAPPAPPAPTGGAPSASSPSGAPGGGATVGGAAANAEPSEALGGAESGPPPEALGADINSSSPGAASQTPAPAWAAQLRRRQAMIQGVTMAAQTLRSADHHGGSAHISLEDRS